MLWIHLLGILILVNKNTLAGHHEKKLLADLFNKAKHGSHNPIERPVLNESDAVPVRFGTTLAQIIDVDEKNQVIKTSLMLAINWKDYHFKWNPKEYGGVTTINVMPNEVWMPDILLYNSADDNFNAANTVKVVIFYDGRMSYIPPGLFKSTCTMDVTWFPFDKQICSLKFGTWSYSGLDVDLKLSCPNDDLMINEGNCTKDGNVDISDYTESGEWQLLSSGLKLYKQKYPCCPIFYVDVKMRIVIQRKAKYYIFNFVLPCIIISGMAILDFLLPSDAGEKISLGVTIMLSLSMFQLLLADNMPQSSLAMPLLAIYFCSMMVLSSLSILFTVLVLSCHHNDHKVPEFIKVTINYWLAKFLFITPPLSMNTEEIKAIPKAMPTPNPKKIFDSKASHSLLANVLELPSDTHDFYQDLHTKQKALHEFETCIDYTINELSEEGESNGVICSTHEELKTVQWHLEFITAKIKESDEEGDLLKEWKFAAYVIDRFCVITFSLCALFVTAGMFIAATTSS